MCSNTANSYRNVHYALSHAKTRSFRTEAAGMKVLIAIVVILIWLLFPVQPLIRHWRRWQARREADKYSQTLFK
jgi:hypothetical protein